jgi:diketogulonate reductase-like aldo/keto reductase
MLILRPRHARTSQNERDSNKPSPAVRMVLAGNARIRKRAFGHAWLAKDSSAPVMISREIPSSGEPLPVIGVGTWQTFDIECGAAEQRSLQEVVQTFADLGGRLIDSSPMYGRSETVVGEISATLSLRNRLFLATKVWTTGRQAGLRQMEESFHKLRVTRMDLMQVHNLVDVATQLETLRQWKEEGRIRYLGITHYTAGAHDAMARLMASEPLDFIQINYSVGEREAERRLLPLAREHGVAVIANRPFAGGDLFRRLRSRSLPEWAAEINCTTWAQVLLKFVISNPAITCVIPATSKVSHVRDNMRAASGPLPNDDLRERIAAESV